MMAPAKCFSHQNALDTLASTVSLRLAETYKRSHPPLYSNLCYLLITSFTNLLICYGIFDVFAIMDPKELSLFSFCCEV